MKVVREFSRFAHEYNKYNVIQKRVAKKLCALLEEKSYGKILDLGAGDGAIYDNLSKQKIVFSDFVALDFSQEMLDIHKNNKSIEKVCLDFNERNFSSVFKANEFDLIISSSALQWSVNLSSVLQELSSLSNKFLFSFFTANTFKTLHGIININSPILKKEEILTSLDRFFDYELEVVEYKIDFTSVHDMLRYIKKSGVSGGVKQLGYKEMKTLMLEYPLTYLEFEVIFIKVIQKK
ncbi:MAG: Biotin synthesis protein BioC [uncultured Sulfurovum sp.]|uniref:Biotin synthesis protein BioC n=1 Tax=uncultured Sulfurovum sp. TaxID=269237 RepID=A0A6S6TIR2_9BACT|nr:MAG: Biotin synthesis protein BioC [uncultured Sulfurovum sp.]